MPWPLLFILPIIIVITGIAIAPDLLTNPDGYFKRLKYKKDAIKKAKEDVMLFKAHGFAKSLPSMLNYSEFVLSTFYSQTNIFFKKTCIYIESIFGFKYVRFYDEFIGFEIGSAKTSPSYPISFRFILKDKEHSAMELRFKNDKQELRKMKEIIHQYINSKDLDAAITVKFSIGEAAILKQLDSDLMWKTDTTMMLGNVEELKKLRDTVVADELCKYGFNNYLAPTEYGLKLENLIGVLNKKIIKIEEKGNVYKITEL